MYTINHTGYSKDDILRNGNRFMIGNGYYGYRGTLDEYTKDEMVQFNLNGIYDQVDNNWRESVNAFNPLYTIIKYNGEECSVLNLSPFKHEQQLDMKDGCVTRKSVFHVKDALLTIESERFADQTHRNIIYSKYWFQSSMALEIDLYSGIDTLVYSASGAHLKNVEFEQMDKFFIFKAKTKELKKEIIVMETCTTSFGIEPENEVGDGKALHHYKVKMAPDQIYVIYKFAGIVHEEENGMEKLFFQLTRAMSLGYSVCHRQNKKFWADKWNVSAVDVTGSQEVDTAIKNCIYHLISVRPYSDKVSIPARGLSGQTYKGAVFWDTEIFMLPFFLNTDIESARHIIKYRINGLPGALAKAKQYGFQGAFYAWESQEDGFDACSDYNITDPETGTPIRTYFREKQIHINSAIVYALKQYLFRTDDVSVLLEGGLEMVFECCRFYANYATFNQEMDRYEFHDVIGPDEYHERVNNNAYTNYMIKFTFDFLFECLRLARGADYPYVREYMKDKTESSDKIKEVRSKLYLPAPNKDGIIEQFDGYYKLEDATVKDVKRRAKNPNEYLGGEFGVATPTRVIKQADVITLLVLQRELFNIDIMKKNFEYYVDRTEHGSSLSASMHGLIAAMIDEVELAVPFFTKSSMIDITGDSKQFVGGIYIGGTHPASSGGSYLSLIYGFSALEHHGYQLSADYRLPKSISGVEFKVIVKDYVASVKVRKSSVEITWEDLL